MPGTETRDGEGSGGLGQRAREGDAGEKGVSDLSLWRGLDSQRKREKGLKRLLGCAVQGQQMSQP